MRLNKIAFIIPNMPVYFIRFIYRERERLLLFMDVTKIKKESFYDVIMCIVTNRILSLIIYITLQISIHTHTQTNIHQIVLLSYTTFHMDDACVRVVDLLWWVCVRLSVYVQLIQWIYCFNVISNITCNKSTIWSIDKYSWIISSRKRQFNVHVFSKSTTFASQYRFTYLLLFA